MIDRGRHRMPIALLVLTRAVLRARDVAAQNIHTGTLTRLARAGSLEKVGPGKRRGSVRIRAVGERPSQGHFFIPNT